MMKLSVFLLMLLMETCSASTYQNVALRGTATQSDRYNRVFGSAISAIDLNRDNKFLSGSCSHTQKESNPWWRVDLLETYVVTSVTSSNRGDCCPEKLVGAQVHIGNSLDNNGVSNPVVGTISTIEELYNLTFTDRVMGCYVTVRIPGYGKVLTLCEVEIYGYHAPTEENLAIEGKASESSVYGNSDAYKAIDGNRDSNWASCSHTAYELNPWWRLALPKTHKVISIKITNRAVRPERLDGAEIRIGDSLVNNGAENPSHTQKESNPWWRVDLLETYVVTSVTSSNRGDCCPEKLVGAQVHIGNSLDNNGVSNPVVGTISTIEELYNLTFTDRVMGCYVTVRIPGYGKVLTLCEVEIYGYHAPTEENLAIEGKASESSVYGNSDAYKAIDGNRDSNWASCSHTAYELNPWWRLALPKTHKVISIKITNRAVRPERLDGAEIRIGDSLVNNGAENPSFANITSIPAGETVEFQVPNGMDGRYVYIGVPGRKEYLVLCEVEVFGSALD